MASIRKRGNTYQITVSAGRDITGRQLIETATFVPDKTKTPKQQQKDLDAFVYEFEQKVKNNQRLQGDKVTLAAFSEYWLKEYAEYKMEPGTVSRYKVTLRDKISPALGHLKMTEIKPLTLTRFYNAMAKDGVRAFGKPGGYAKATIQKMHNILSSMFRCAVTWEIIETNPCSKVSPQAGERDITETVKYWTAEQAILFLSVIEKPYTVPIKGHDRIDDTGKPYHVDDYTMTKVLPLQFRVLFNLALFGGLRKGELLALTWDDIDFEHNSISITKSMALVDGVPLIKKPKTKGSVRTVTVPKSIMNMLKVYRAEQIEYRFKLADYWKGENWIFIQQDGKLMNYYTPYSTFKDVIRRYNDSVQDEKLKLPDIPFHGLRHTSATLLIGERVDVRTVAARLGHSETSTTLNIYAHALKEHDTIASDSLEKRLLKNA